MEILSVTANCQQVGSEYAANNLSANHACPICGTTLMKLWQGGRRGGRGEGGKGKKIPNSIEFIGLSRSVNSTLSHSFVLHIQQRGLGKKMGGVSNSTQRKI